MSQFKGSVFESTRVFTETEFGAGATARVLAELDASDRELLSGISVLGWYPVEPILRYHHALGRSTTCSSSCCAFRRRSA